MLSFTRKNLVSLICSNENVHSVVDEAVTRKQEYEQFMQAYNTKEVGWKLAKKSRKKGVWVYHRQVEVSGGGVIVYVAAVICIDCPLCDL